MYKCNLCNKTALFKSNLSCYRCDDSSNGSSGTLASVLATELIVVALDSTPSYDFGSCSSSSFDSSSSSYDCGM